MAPTIANMNQKARIAHLLVGRGTRSSLMSFSLPSWLAVVYSGAAGGAITGIAVAGGSEATGSSGGDDGARLGPNQGSRCPGAPLPAAAGVAAALSVRVAAK